MKPIVFSLFLGVYIFSFQHAIGQSPPQILCEIKNCVQTQPNEIEFEYWLTNLNTNGTILKLNALTLGLNYDPSINGLFANSTGSLVYLNPALSPAILGSTNVVTNPAIGYMRYNSGIELAASAVIIPQAPGIMFGKFKITSSFPFVSPTPLNFLLQPANVGVRARNTISAYSGTSTIGSLTAWTGIYCPLVVSNPCNNIYNAITNVTGCTSYTWPLNGATYTASGIYTHATPIVGTSCFTYDLLDLTVSPITSNVSNVTTCSSYTWNVSGLSYSVSGSYTVPNAGNPCSNDVLNLTLLPNINSMVTAQNITNCAGAQIDLTNFVSPAGGSFNVSPATAYIPPQGISTYSYTYFDPTLNCSGTASGTLNMQTAGSVTGLTCMTTTNNTATLTWNTTPFIAWYTIRYRVQGSVNWSYVSTTNTTYYLTNLNNATTYEVQIRGNCFITSAGPYSSSINFTTL